MGHVTVPQQTPAEQEEETKGLWVTLVRIFSCLYLSFVYLKFL